MNSYRRIPNLNILPEEHRTSPLSIVQICLIAVIIVAALLGYRSYQQRSDNLDAVVALENELKQWAITGELSQKADQADQLAGEIFTLEQELSNLQAAREQIKTRQVDWPDFLSSLLSTSGPALESITQNGLEIYVTGTANGIQELRQYRDNLLSLSSVTTINIPTLNQTEQGISFQMVILVKGE